MLYFDVNAAELSDWIGLVQRAVAPNSDFAVVHRLDDFMAKVIRYAINHHPRKTLNWLTPTQGLSGIFNLALRG